jgi:hypothetical protein
MTKVTIENDGIEEDAAGEAAGLSPGLTDFLDAALAKVSAGGRGGWDDLDPRTVGASLEKQRREQAQAMRHEAALFRDVFMTPEGQKLLNYLIGRTLLRSTWPLEGMTSMEMLTANGIWREAENSFVAGFIEAIAVAENQRPKRRSET